jgi:hypothetical protein
MRTTEGPSVLSRILHAAFLLVVWWLLTGATPASAQITFNVLQLLQILATDSAGRPVIAGSTFFVSKGGGLSPADTSQGEIVESTNGVPINVESGGLLERRRVIWEAGGNTVAAPIP